MDNTKIGLHKYSVFMLIYKYKSLKENLDESVSRIIEIVLERKFWCAAPAALNDPDEFKSKYRCTRSAAETDALIRTVSELNGHSKETATRLVKEYYKNEKDLRSIANPIFTGMVDHCRKEIGLSCFSKVGDSPELWQRYGGSGNGVCIALDVPNIRTDTSFNVIDTTDGLHTVDYVKNKTILLVTVLKSRWDARFEQELFRSVLLTKTKDWCGEEEVRFVARRQNVKVFLDCEIKKVRFGGAVRRDVKEMVAGIIRAKSSGVEIE